MRKSFYSELKRKLCSRKLWVAVSAFVAGIIVTCGGSEKNAQSISGAIMSGAAVVAYCVGEGLADSDSKKGK